DRDAELALERESQLEEIERVRSEVVGERYVSGEFLGGDPQFIGYDLPHARLRNAVEHTHLPTKKSAVGPTQAPGRPAGRLSFGVAEFCSTERPWPNPPKLGPREKRSGDGGCPFVRHSATGRAGRQCAPRRRTVSSHARCGADRSSLAVSSSR